MFVTIYSIFGDETGLLLHVHGPFETTEEARKHARETLEKVLETSFTSDDGVAVHDHGNEFTIEGEVVEQSIAIKEVTKP